MIDQEKTFLYTITLLHSRQLRWKSATWKKNLTKNDTQIKVHHHEIVYAA